MKRVFILLILILLAAACGRGGNENGIGDLPDGDVITVAVGIWHEAHFRRAADALIANMALEGRKVRVDFITYMQGEEDEHYHRMFGMLFAGSGPDVMIVPQQDIWTLIQNGLLADLNTFIDNRSDFYENVLSAYEIGGALYAMPMSFNLEFIGINSKVPQSFIDRFAALEYVNIMDIAIIYHDLIYEYPEFAGYNIIRSRGLLPLEAIIFEIGQHIDFGERTASLSHLYDFIVKLMQMFEGYERADIPFVFPPTDESMALYAEHYIFSLTRDPIQAMFPFSQASFVHYIPHADMQGRLIDSSRGQSVSVSSTAPPLAWAFLEQLILYDDFNQGISIRRDIMRARMEQIISLNLQWQEIRPFTGNEFMNIQNVLNRLEIYAKRPIASHMPNRILAPCVLYSLQRVFGLLLEHEIEQALTEYEDIIITWLNDILK